MLKRSEKISVVISCIIGAVFLVALVFAAFWLPVVVNSMIDVTDNIGNRNEISQLGRALILIDAYAMLSLAALAVGFLFFLLSTVYRHEVFSKRATGLISAISWCCFGESLLSLLLITQFQLVIIVTLAACFLGLCLRVVRQVIDEASRIKAENDFTI